MAKTSGSTRGDNTEKGLFTVRNGKVVGITHLRGKLYISKDYESTIKIINGKRYAGNSKDEMLVSEKNIFATRKSAEDSRAARLGNKQLKHQKEAEELNRYSRFAQRMVNTLYKWKLEN